MMKAAQIITLTIFWGMSVLIFDAPAQAQENPDMNALVKGNTAFALDLYGKLKAEKGNLFFSPYSISTALAMTYAGARGNTEKEMASALRFTLTQERLHPAYASLEKALNTVREKGEIQLNIANALWPHKDYNFLPEFLKLTEKNYGVLIHSLDYADSEAARKEINKWVEKETEDKISDLIQPGILSSLTRLVLVNAIYFKGNWMRQFDKNLTEDAPFWISAEKSVKTPMMTQKQRFMYGETDDLQILSLPYVVDLSMTLILPKKRDGLSETENALTTETLEQWTENLGMREVIVFIPKFRLSSGFSLNEMLKSMGMTDAFGEKADFSGMDDGKLLFISDVIHKAYVDVGEEGTEAAAATAVVMRTRSAFRPEPPTFRADHPFIFLIRDNNTGSILFLGRIEKP